jgi:predicted AAA+ superfamily ATPase
MFGSKQFMTDINQLRIISLSLLNSVEKYRRRYVVERLLKSLKSQPRIKLLRGFRGVGKTTALLHAFGAVKESALYFSADHPASAVVRMVKGRASPRLRVCHW